MGCPSYQSSLQSGRAAAMTRIDGMNTGSTWCSPGQFF
jgi:hypothetical protein